MSFLILPLKERKNFKKWPYPLHKFLVGVNFYLDFFSVEKFGMLIHFVTKSLALKCEQKPICTLCYVTWCLDYSVKQTFLVS